MSNNEIKKDLSDADIEKLFKASNEDNPVISRSSSVNNDLTKKIVKKARTETSAKTITEYSLVNFWATLLEFVNIFCTLLDPKKVKETNNNTNKDNKEQ